MRNLRLIHLKQCEKGEMSNWSRQPSLLTHYLFYFLPRRHLHYCQSHEQTKVMMIHRYTLVIKMIKC